jgi:hypothetical protein
VELQGAEHAGAIRFFSYTQELLTFMLVLLQFTGTRPPRGGGHVAGGSVHPLDVIFESSEQTLHTVPRGRPELCAVSSMQEGMAAVKFNSNTVWRAKHPTYAR